ncbi:MAG: B12-binding domain-containing radical SAM protein [Thermoanaerobaculales bacterium]|nr:B12-binding domain-containing radical SAM protein [Thermoanaerobaculales bacterium]
MRVLLINPTQAYAIDSEAGGAVEAGVGCYPPLGLFHLQAALKAVGRHEAVVFDANLLGEAYEESLGRRIGEFDPNLIGVLTLTPNLPSVVHTVETIRRIQPSASVVIGGPHTRFFAEETSELEGVDFVLPGEAEYTLPMLADQLEAGREPLQIPGLVTKLGLPLISGEGAPPPEDLDALPLPDRSGTEIHAYRGIGGLDCVFTTIITSRGCPHRCTFCSTPRGKYRVRSVASVVEEMSRCADLGIEHIYFLDDTFPTTGTRARELFDTLAGRPDLPSWSCRTTAGGLGEETLSQMKKAGCLRVQVGVETWSDEGLGLLGKKTSIEKIRRTFAAARKVGMPSVAYFMLGLPHERSAADVRQLSTFARALAPTYAMFNVLTLYPGTELFRQAVDKGMTSGDVWRQFARQPDTAFEPPIWNEYLSRDQLNALQDEVYRSFYLRPGVILREALTGGGLRRKVKAGLRMLFSSRRTET